MKIFSMNTLFAVGIYTAVVAATYRGNSTVAASPMKGGGK